MAAYGMGCKVNDNNEDLELRLMGVRPRDNNKSCSKIVKKKFFQMVLWQASMCTSQKILGACCASSTFTTSTIPQIAAASAAGFSIVGLGFVCLFSIGIHTNKVCTQESPGSIQHIYPMAVVQVPDAEIELVELPIGAIEMSEESTREVPLEELPIAAPVALGMQDR